MGIQYGEAFAERIRRFVEVRFAAMEVYTRERGRSAGSDGIMDVGRESLGIYATWDPDGYEELVGIAEGAGLSPDRLYTATNMTDMRDILLLSEPIADAEGCSSLIVPPGLARDGNALAGQTWDLNPSDIEFVVGIRRRPTHGLQTWTVTCAGCHTLVAINERGLSLGTTNIKTRGARPGVGYLGLLHRMAGAETAVEAAHILETAPRAGAHTYWIADETDQFDYETSPDRVVARRAGDGALCHTNHCLDSAHTAIEGEPPSDSSRTRLRKVGNTLAKGGHTVETLRALFSDRSDGLESVNRYAEDEQGTATNACFIAVPGRREAHACRGPADRGRWMRLHFDD
jgi:isopenicillin-N N-acyltransferase-like protein